MSTFDFSVVGTAWPFLLKGLWFSIELTSVAFAGGLALGCALAIIRHMNLPVAAQIVAAYVTLMRSIPLILVLFWFFFLVPLVLAPMSGSGRPVPVGPIATAFVTFTLFEAAYYAEIIRAGLISIHPGQYDAAKALGLSRWKTYRLVILPQVLRTVSPIILTQTIILFQDTSLVYVLSVTDLLGAASKIAQRDGRLVEMYLTVAAIYLAICFALSQLVAWFNARTAVPGH